MCVSRLVPVRKWSWHWVRPAGRAAPSAWPVLGDNSGQWTHSVTHSHHTPPYVHSCGCSLHLLSLLSWFPRYSALQYCILAFCCILLICTTCIPSLLLLWTCTQVLCSPALVKCQVRWQLKCFYVDWFNAVFVKPLHRGPQTVHVFASSLLLGPRM